MLIRAATIGVIVLASTAPAPVMAQAASPSTLFHHVRVFDGVKLLGERDVLVSGGRIAAIGTTVTAPAGADTVDGTGATLLPGLIDSHTHAFGDALQQALVFGVTTELDMFSDPTEDARLRAEQAAGNVANRADIRSAGILATAPKGHGTEYGFPIPTVSSPDSAQAFVDARIREGSDYIKIVYDDGSTYGMTIPTLAPEVLRALVKAAHARGKLAVIHIGSLTGAREAIADGVDGLEHLFVDREPDAEFGKFVAEHHAFVVPTLTVLKSVTGVSGAGDLADNAQLSPYLSASSLSTIRGAFPKRAGSSISYEAAESAVKQLRAAGVPILAGTDAGNPGTAHGIALHRELELLVHAGLTPSEALASATSIPARLFSLSDRGRIAVGERADLLLVNGNPTSDITATRSIKGVWKGGVQLDRAAVAAKLAPAVKAAAASVPANGVVSNFDDGSTKTSFGMPWVVTTDQLAGGTSTATMTVVDGGANGTPKSLESKGTIGAGLLYAWSGVLFMPGSAPMQPTSLLPAKFIKFWARGDGRTYHVMVFAASRGRIPLMQPFVAGPEWKQYSLPIALFDGIDGHDVMGIAFTGGPAAGAFNFRIDEVVIQ